MTMPTLQEIQGARLAKARTDYSDVVDKVVLALKEAASNGDSGVHVELHNLFYPGTRSPDYPEPGDTDHKEHERVLKAAQYAVDMLKARGFEARCVDEFFGAGDASDDVNGCEYTVVVKLYWGAMKQWP